MKNKFTIFAIVAGLAAASLDTKAAGHDPASSPRHRPGASYCVPAGSGAWVCFECKETASGMLCVPKLVVGPKPFDPIEP